MENDAEITLNIRAKSVDELIQKLKTALGQYTDLTHVQRIEPQQDVDFSDEIKKAYPKFRTNKLTPAILTVLKKQPGKTNALYTGELAEAIKKEFPTLYGKKTDIEMIKKITLPADKLVKKGKIKKDKLPSEEGDYNVYWIE